MKDDIKEILCMLNGNDCTEMGYHPLMFLLKVIVFPVFIFYFVVPDMNAINTTLRGVARFQQMLCGLTFFTVLVAYLVVGYLDVQGVLYAIHAKVNKLSKVFISLMLAVDAVMIGALIVLMIQLKTIGA